jgi:hypothetical protein
LVRVFVSGRVDTDVLQNVQNAAAYLLTRYGRRQHGIYQLAWKTTLAEHPESYQVQIMPAGLQIVARSGTGINIRILCANVEL